MNRARGLPESLQTERLVLREPRGDDAPPLFDTYTRDPEVARYTMWRPHTSIAETEEFIAGCIRDWLSGERLAYMLTLRDIPDRVVGVLDARPISHLVGIGYVLARPYWGKGLMPEAIRALTDAALRIVDIYRVQATCDVDNHASARALEKSGFAREGRLERYTIHPNVSSEPKPCFMYARHR